MTAANTAPAAPPPPPPPPQSGRGTWLFALATLADGTLVELRIPGCVSGSVSTYDAPDGEVPSLTLVMPDGSRRRGRLAQLFGGGT